MTVSITKEGVDKTTLAANLDGTIAGRGKQVLLMDSSSQPSLASYYKVIAGDYNSGLTNFLTDVLSLAPRKTSIDYLDIILSDDPSAWLKA